MASQQVDIRTIPDSNWQLSNTDFGQVAVGANDILQSIHNILFTMKGEVPFLPLFGSDLFKLIDNPVNIVGPQIVAEIIDAVGKWEPRVAVQKCTWALGADYSNIIFNLNMIAISSSSPLGYTLTLSISNNNKRAFSDGFTTSAFS